jgi:hypothetical protein
MIIVLIPAKTITHLDTLPSEVESVRSLMITDRGVSIGLAGEISNRLHYGPDELIPVRAGLYEACKLRGGYPNRTLGGAYGLTTPTVRTDYGTL